MENQFRPDCEVDTEGAARIEDWLDYQAYLDDQDRDYHRSVDAANEELSQLYAEEMAY